MEKITASSPASFATEIKKITTTDVAHPDTFNPQLQQLLDNTVQNREHLEERFQNANEYANNLIEKLVGSAPETLDTIHELAEAIQENDTIIDALDRAITEKLGKNDTAARSVADKNGIDITDGYLKKYKTNTSFSTPGWYRIIGMKISDNDILDGAAGQSFIININRGYVETSPEQYSILCRNVHSSLDFKLYSKKIANTQTITEIRGIRETDGFYIDIYFNQSRISGDMSISIYQNDGAWNTYVNVISPATITSSTTPPRAELDLVNTKDIFARLDNINVAILNPKPIITLPAPQLKTYTHISNANDYRSILLYKVPTSSPCDKIGMCGMLMEDRGYKNVWSQQNAMFINTCYSNVQNINEIIVLSEMSSGGAAKIAKATYENEQYIVLIKTDPASSFYFTGSTWGDMLFKEVETTRLTIDYTNVSNFNPKKRIQELENINGSQRYGTRVVTVTGNYTDLEIENTSGAIAAYASIGNMTSETASIYVKGCTILNSNKIRVFLNQEVQGTLLRINYFVTKVQ